MRPGKRRVSCVPCAKRKVRCDQLQPCCHCKRRPQDECEYPIETPEDTTQSGNERARIGILEEYIRQLGGDPDRATQRLSASGSPTSGRLRVDRSKTPIITTRQKLLGSNESTKPLSALVDHGGEGSAYIETPTWLTWQSETDLSQTTRHEGDSAASSQSFCRTILDSHGETLGTDMPYFLSTHIKSLWTAFLINAHPLIKLFFDWEIAPIIDNAEHGMDDLSDHESALVTAIAFVGTVTLTEDQCLALWGSGKSQTLSKLQQTAEGALLQADYAGTTRLMTLQAFMLYLIGLHNRARPTILFSLWGIASRVAERLGVHRNGESLGLSVLRSEERRRVWWQMQLQEIYSGRLIGKVNLTLIADWDATIPANIDDGDLDANSTILPEPKKALTSMAPSLWLYRLFQMHRESMRPTSIRSVGVSPWTIFSDVSVAEKDELIDHMESRLRLEFLQHCDLLDPSHLYIQHGINHFVVSARRAARQPSLINAKISEMSQVKRDEMLGLCLKTLEYYIFFCSTEALQRFRWHSSFQFQMLALIYIILEAYHRSQDETAARGWDVIERVYAVHPTLAAAETTPEIRYVSRITLAAWRRRHPNLEDADGNSSWIAALSRRCDSPAAETSATADHSVPMSWEDSDWNFDFDLIDWSTWAEFDMSQRAV